MRSIDEAIRRAIECQAMLYDERPENGDRELRFLYELAKLAPTGLSVECGVHRGGSFFCWTCAREGPFYVVDDWSSKTEALFLENLARYKMKTKTTVLTMTAAEAPEHIPGEVAFCFDDACHGPEGIGQDIRVWPAKIKPNGILVFHDYGTWKCPAVKIAVDSWQKTAKWQFLSIVGSTVAYRRPA